MARYKMTQKARRVATWQDGGKTYAWYAVKDRRGNTRDVEVQLIPRNRKFKLASRKKKSSGSSGG